LHTKIDVSITTKETRLEGTISTDLLFSLSRNIVRIKDENNSFIFPFAFAVL